MGEDFFQDNMIQWDTFQRAGTIVETTELNYFGVVQYSPRPYINKKMPVPEIVEP